MKHIHLVGVGGVGMSGIAMLLLKKKGCFVSGSDLKESSIVDNLKKAGAHIFIGHRRENLAHSVDSVVYSSAIKDDNPEIIEAKKRGVALYRRAEMLSILMEGKRVITISGAHGKTTTTAVVAYILSQAGLKPTVAIGGLIKNFAINAWLGEGNFFVAEADESDGSFLNYTPDFSIITNIDKEHLDYYGSFPALLKAFEQFMARVRDDGLLIVPLSDKRLMNLAKKSGKRFKTYGLERKADIWAGNIRHHVFSSQFDCFLGSNFIGTLTVPLAGEHNILNSLAAILVSLELHVDFEKIARAIEGYQGTKRRLDIKFKSPKVLVVDDYAHHPTEIQATLKAIKQGITAGTAYKRIIVAFQPHRYSRTKLLLDELSNSFDAADYLVITDIYAASEEPIPGIDAQSLCQRIKGTGKNNVYYLGKGVIVEHILKNLSGSDVVVFLGAGDITKLSDEFTQILKKD
jgi:UDP-N-acetylmuramate--alanine ligase